MTPEWWTEFALNLTFMAFGAVYDRLGRGNQVALAVEHPASAVVAQEAVDGM